MTYVIMGIVTAFNFLVIVWKLQKGRLSDGLLDIAAFLILTSIFTTMGGMFVGMVASFIISLYLFLNPPKLPGKFQKDAEVATKKFSEQSDKAYEELINKILYNGKGRPK